MGVLTNLRIATRVTIASALGLAVMLTVGFVGWLNARDVGRHLDEVADRRFPAAAALAKIEASQNFAMRGINAQFMTRLSSDLRTASQGFVDTALARIEEARAEFEAIPQSPEVAADWQAMQAPYSAWKEDAIAMLRNARECDRLLAAGAGAESEEVVALEDESWRHWVRLREELPRFQEALAGVQARIGAEVKDARVGAAAARRRNSRIGILAVALGAAVMIGFAWSLSRSVNGCVRKLRREAEELSTAIAAGDLERRADAAAVGVDFEAAVAGMNRVVDAFTPPMRLSIRYIRELSGGVKPTPVEGEWSGEFRDLKDGWNALIAVLDMRAQDIELLTRAARDGELDVRADVARYSGYNGKIISSVHGMIDAIAAPLREAAEVLAALGRRDLTVRMRGEYAGEYARMMESVNATAEALHGALAQVATAVDQVSSASSQIAASSHSVADGASEQAAALEETSSQLESMTAMTRQASGHAHQANGLAAQARVAATHGAKAMDEMGSAMGRIRAAAEGTSQIIKDINEIAFQTNLLALNAAVEAARAGDAGRGFAVVAEEVRSLALRSKEAATKTEELIRQSVREAGDGEVTSRDVSARLVEIVAAIGKVSDIVAEIDAAAKEQAAGIGQVSAAVSQMDKVTQQNATSSEESSAAAAELSGQSQELAAMVATFRLEAGPSAGVSRVGPDAARPRRGPRAAARAGA